MTHGPEDGEEDFRGRCICEVKNHQLLLCVASPNLITVLTSIRMLFDLYSGEVDDIPDLHAVETNAETLDQAYDWLGLYVEAHANTLYPAGNSWIGMHAMVGQLMNGYLHMALEEWPYEGQYAATFHLLNSDLNDKIYQHLISRSLLFLALIEECDVFEEPRDMVASSDLLHNAATNVQQKRHIVTGKPHLQIVVSNVANENGP